jgi:hypothetical protein
VNDRDFPSLTTPGDGQWIGAGLICVEARYCSRPLLGGGWVDSLAAEARAVLITASACVYWF